MLIPERKSFVIGLVMGITFFVVFGFLFTPSFGGKNAFEASDDLFNSIAKGSTYYIPNLRAQAEQTRGSQLKVALSLAPDNAAARSLLASNGVELSEEGGASLDVSTDLGDLLLAALGDSEAMFHNRGEEIAAKYGMPERQALLTWWQILTATERALTNQRRFKEAAFVAEVTTRGVEVAYNFYGIEPEKMSSKAGILSFSLIFYVLYTLWWGYAIYYLAQGLGLQLKGGAKKEV
jgi:hypothetical protein